MKWNFIYQQKGIVQSRVLDIVKKFEKILPNKNLKVLDLGCGTGRHTFYLSRKKDRTIYAFDLSKKGIEIIKEKCKNKNILNVKTKIGNFSKLPFKNSSFDAILSTKALHHGSYNQINQYVSEINKVLKKGGLLLLVILSNKDFREKTGINYQGDERTKINCDNLPDSEIPHHFFNEEELKEIFSGYKFLEKKIVKRIAMKGLKPSIYYDLILKKL